MRRLRLATKLALAIVPIGLVALAMGAFVSWTSLQQAEAEERVSSAAQVTADAMDALVAVSSERARTVGTALGTVEGGLDSVRSASDAALERLRGSVRVLTPQVSGPASDIASRLFTDSSRAVSLLGRIRGADPLAEDTTADFEELGRRLISVVAQSTLYLGDATNAREGAASTALARASFTSFQQELLHARAQADVVDPDVFAVTVAGLETTVFDWVTAANDASSTVTSRNFTRTQVVGPEEASDPEIFPFERNEVLAGAATDILGRVSETAAAASVEARNEAITVATAVLGVILVAALMAFFVGRSTVKRVRSVTAAARHVSEVELPKMVDALSNPSGQLEATTAIHLDQTGPDEVGDLARSFSALHHTLVDVANQQMDTLRRGVSDIFVTLARRNRSLVDRQLALVDDLEAREEDPEVLDGYYKLDHLATRMRRNAESLLVLAGSESPRLWADPIDMGDVIRAALGEVDEYQRVDVLAMEPALLAGRAVTDLAHLVSELLDNAAHYSPPDERVRVTGLFDDNGYVVTIADSGVGISEARLAQLNRLIEEPPVLGLALEPTLGIYVVARLAARHGIAVRLVPGVPGTTVRITIPRQLLEVTATAAKEAPALELVDKPVDDEMSPPPKKEVVIPDFAFRAGAHGRLDQSPIGTDDLSSEIVRDGSHAHPPVTPATPATPAAELPLRRAPVDPTSDTPRHRPATHSHTRVTVTPPVTSPSPSPVSAGPVETPEPRPVDVAGSPPPASHGDDRLPTRRPGASFRETGTAVAASSAVSDRGATGIRNALDGFKQGRDTAAGDDGAAPGDDGGSET